MKEKTDSVHNAYPEGSFSRLFWDEQLRANSVSNLCQMRWHPLIVKWCLHLKFLSGGAYHALRSSGFVKLPSERTLRDYTHCYKEQLGFQKELLVQLAKETKDLEGSRRYVSLIFDEMKVKQDLVYDKYSGHIVGFVSLGSINDELTKLESSCINGMEHPPIAKQLLVFMVRGLFSKLSFPYVHFATRGVTGAALFPIVWEVIEQLESIDLKVICVTSDGASPNRKFYKLNNNGKFTYKTSNPYAEDERDVFFFSDPPHLVKTARNCLSHSGPSGTRHMNVSGKLDLGDVYVLSYSVCFCRSMVSLLSGVILYERLSTTYIESCGISLIPKLRLEHVKLTSFSRMRVDLAAQVQEYTTFHRLLDYGCCFFRS